jgi:hypothetical protein
MLQSHGHSPKWTASQQMLAVPRHMKCPGSGINVGVDEQNKVLLEDEETRGDGKRRRSLACHAWTVLACACLADAIR